MTEFYRDNKKAIDKFLFITITVTAVYVFARFFIAYFSPFIIGYLISLIIGKPVDFLHGKLKIWRGVCVLFMLLLSVSAILAGGFLIGYRLLMEIESLAQRLPDYIAVIQNALDSAQYAFNRFMIDLPDIFGRSLDGVIADWGAAAAVTLGGIVTEATVNFAATLPRFVLVTVLSVISAFFFTKDKKIINAAIANLSPAWLTRHFTLFKRTLYSAVGGYIRAQLILMSVIVALNFLGLTIIGIPYAIFIGLAIGLVDFIPVLGSGTVLIPWALVSFASGNVRLGVSLLVLYVVCLLTRQSLEPKLVGERIGLHPILTLMSIFIGLSVFGPIGIIIGPFIAIALKVIIVGDNLKK